MTDAGRAAVVLELAVARRRAAVAIGRLREDVTLHGAADRDLVDRAQRATARVAWLENQKG